MAGRDDAPGCHSARHARLSSIDSNTVESFLLTSPRSLEACARHGVRIDELQHRSCEDFVREAEGEGYVADVGRRRFRVREKKRQEQLATVKQEYQTICMARFQEDVARVLADLTKGAKHFVSYTMAGIYTHEVYDELERAIAAEGRRYLRYPPPYAKAAGEPDPGLDKIVCDLHQEVKAVVERDLLLEPIDEWDRMVKVGCDLRPGGTKGDDEKATPEAPALQFEEIIGKLEELFPNTSGDEREEFARQGLVMETGSVLLPPESLANTLPNRATCASSRRADRRPVLAPPSCAHCRAPCRQGACECPRCKQSYCCRHCRVRDWSSRHARECVELQPLEMEAGNLARTWLQASAEGPPVAPVPCKKPMDLKWHSIEQELTARCAEEDWGGALRLEAEAMLAAKALVTEWPEASLRIYNMLSDTFKALGDNDSALELLQWSEALTKEGANREMEAQVLETIADFYHNNLKNDHKAVEYLYKTVPAWRAAGDRVGEGKVLDKLGSLLSAQEKHAVALENFSLAIAIARAVGDVVWVTKLEKDICTCNTALSNFDQALKFRQAEKKKLRLAMVDLRQHLSKEKARALDHTRPPSPPHFFTPRPHTSGQIGRQPDRSSFQQVKGLRGTSAEWRRDAVCTPGRTLELYHEDGRLQERPRTAVTSFSATLSTWGRKSYSTPPVPNEAHPGFSERDPADPFRRMPFVPASTAQQHRARPVSSPVSSGLSTTDTRRRRDGLDWGTGKQHGDRPHTSNVTKRLGSGRSAAGRIGGGWPSHQSTPSTLAGRSRETSGRTSYSRLNPLVQTQRSQSRVLLKCTKFSEEAKPTSLVWDGHEEREGETDGEKGGRESMRNALQPFPGTRMDLLTVYTDECGLKVPGWLPHTPPVEEKDPNLRFPNSPVARLRPSSVADAMRTCDLRLLSARENLVKAWKARQPDTSKEEEEARRLQEEKEAQERQRKEEEEEARRQKEMEHEAAIKANAHNLFLLISQIAAKQLDMFRVLVAKDFLRDKQEFDAVVANLSHQLMPLSEHERALSKVQASALLFRNLGPEKEEAARGLIEQHVDVYLQDEQERAAREAGYASS